MEEAGRIGSRWVSAWIKRGLPWLAEDELSKKNGTGFARFRHHSSRHIKKFIQDVDRLPNHPAKTDQ
jgi:hypothetical protein